MLNLLLSATNFDVLSSSGLVPPPDFFRGSLMSVFFFFWTHHKLALVPKLQSRISGSDVVVESFVSR